jgi:hypothetical protein
VSFWKAEQLLALATMVAARHAGITLDDVIERFSVSKRTAQRMLRALEAQFTGTSVSTDGEGRKRWHLPSGALRDLMSLSPEELAALDIAIETQKRSGLAAEADQPPASTPTTRPCSRRRGWLHGRAPASASTVRSLLPLPRPSRPVASWRSSISRAARWPRAGAGWPPTACLRDCDAICSPALKTIRPGLCISTWSKHSRGQDWTGIGAPWPHENGSGYQALA